MLIFSIISAPTLLSTCSPTAVCRSTTTCGCLLYQAFKIFRFYEAPKEVEAFQYVQNFAQIACRYDRIYSVYLFWLTIPILLLLLLVFIVNSTLLDTASAPQFLLVATIALPEWRFVIEKCPVQDLSNLSSMLAQYNALRNAISKDLLKIRFYAQE